MKSLTLFSLALALALTTLSCSKQNETGLPVNESSQSSEAPALTDDAMTDGLAALRESRYEDAIREFQKALVQKRVPEEAIHRALGMAYYGTGNMYSQAIDELELALALNPNDGMGQLHLGRAYLEERNFDKAREAFEKSVRLVPEEPEAWYNLGLVQMQAGELDNAEKSFKTAVKLNDDDLMYHRHLALVYKGQGKYSPAIKEMKTVRSLSQKKKFGPEVIEKIDQEIAELQNMAG